MASIETAIATVQGATAPVCPKKAQYRWLAILTPTTHYNIDPSRSVIQYHHKG